MNDDSSSKISQERSPRSPSDSLAVSIELIGKAYAQIGRSPVPAEALAKALGYASLSGSSRTTLASLSYYGLLERLSNNHRVSDLALRIIKPVSEADKAAAIKAASIEPKIFSAISHEHPDCSELVLANLLTHRGFTEEGAKRAAKVFRENMEFVKQFVSSTTAAVAASPALKSISPENVASKPQLSQVNVPIVAQSAPATIPMVPCNELPVPIGDNMVARVPFPMSEEDFELFLGTLQLWKKKLVRKFDAPTNAKRQYPALAIWKNADHDQAITVIGEWSEGGRIYFQVQESQTGIPAEQVVFS